MNSPEQIKQALRDLFESQRYAVLATHRERSPHLGLVAFAGTADLRELIFATERDTAKYANLSAQPCVAMLMDNRSNQSGDTQHAIAVTATGTAEEARQAEREQVRSIYLRKHSHLEGFVRPPSCALICLKVETYRVAIGIGTVYVLQMSA